MGRRAGGRKKKRQRKIKCKIRYQVQYPKSESQHDKPKVLPFEIQSRILERLQIEDLFGSCLLVCKQWKDEILLSEHFSRRQDGRSLWAYLKSRTPYLRDTPYYPNKGLVFQNGSYKVLNMMLERGESVICFDKGVVCLWRIPCVGQMRVGNPIKGNWKVIPAPSKSFHPRGISVDTSISPASFKIVAYKIDLRSGGLQTAIFDSKINTWNKGNIVPLNGPYQDKLGRTLVVAYQARREIVTYDFEQDIWSVTSYVSPETTGREEVFLVKENPHRPWWEEILLCKEEPILASQLWPWVMLWKENSCCKGIIQWGLIAKLDIKAFLPQHKLEGHYRMYAHCTGDVIVFVLTLPWEKIVLLNYDMRKGCWELGGLMQGACALGEDLGVNFTPSLITV